MNQMFAIFELWAEAITVHCTMASFLTWGHYYAIVLLTCLYFIYEKYVFACL